VVDVRDDEVAALFWAGAYCFAVLASFYVLRPLREEMGVAGGWKNLPWMWTGTFAAMFAASPLFSLLVTHFTRRRFIPYAYHFFTANLLVFCALLHWLAGDARLGAARALYIWISVFNLFVVSVFWGYMADVFHSEQGKRLFGFIAAGGTLGGIAGSGLTKALVHLIGSEQLLLVAAVMVEAAVLAFRCLDRMPLAWEAPAAAPAGDPAPAAAASPAASDAPLARTGAWGGLTLVLASPYLLMITLYMLLFNITSAFASIELSRNIAEAIASPETRTAAFANIDFWVNTLVLVVQSLMTGRILRTIGIGPALGLLPAASMAGFVAVLSWPGVAVMSAFQVLRRGTDFAVAKPAREVLYTVIDREEKYKAKSFLDTFVYRGTDAIGAWIYHAVISGGNPAARVAAASLPLTGAWLGVCLWLGRRQRSRAAAIDAAPAPAPAI
jgi:AAA family ATP:ADP antiporter